MVIWRQVGGWGSAEVPCAVQLPDEGPKFGGASGPEFGFGARGAAEKKLARRGEKAEHRAMRDADSSKSGRPFLDVFVRCAEGIGGGKLITRESRQDKEFHFQNWFKARLTETRLNFEVGGRNTYPDFRLVATTDGFEVKGLAYPGREANYDCNSQVPSGSHNGRTIYYVFGRYPAEPDADSYPVLDLVVCHGDFLNADHTYVHKNKSVKGFGSYGDIMIRDRKMYVAPTPFGLTSGTAHNQTLILPVGAAVDARFVEVGRLARREAEKLIVGYTFNLRTNMLTPELVDNPSAGKEHLFRAYRLKGARGEAVAMRPVVAKMAVETEDEDGDE